MRDPRYKHMYLYRMIDLCDLHSMFKLGKIEIGTSKIYLSIFYIFSFNNCLLPVASSWRTGIRNPKKNLHILLLLGITSHPGSKTLNSSIFCVHYATLNLKMQFKTCLYHQLWNEYKVGLFRYILCSVFMIYV